MSELRDLIAADAASGGVFTPLETNGAAAGFNQWITFYPEYDKLRAVPVNAIVDEAHPEGTRETFGDGVVTDRDQGLATRRSITVECPVSVPVRPHQPRRNPDVFVIDDEVFTVIRIMGKDQWMQSVLCVSLDQTEERIHRRRG